MKLFDYIKVLFGKEEEWRELTQYDKRKNVFMVNRFMAAQYPKQANLFNKLKTDPVSAAECWRSLGRKFNRVPGFIYTKIKSNKIDKQWEPDEKSLNFYLKINEIGEREFKEALLFKPKEVRACLDAIKKQIQDSGE